MATPRFGTHTSTLLISSISADHWSFEICVYGYVVTSAEPQQRSLRHCSTDEGTIVPLFRQFFDFGGIPRCFFAFLSGSPLPFRCANRSRRARMEGTRFAPDSALTATPGMAG